MGYQTILVERPEWTSEWNPGWNQEFKSDS